MTPTIRPAIPNSPPGVTATPTGSPDGTLTSTRTATSPASETTSPPAATSGIAERLIWLTLAGVILGLLFVLAVGALANVRTYQPMPPARMPCPSPGGPC